MGLLNVAQLRMAFACRPAWRWRSRSSTLPLEMSASPARMLFHCWPVLLIGVICTSSPYFAPRPLSRRRIGTYAWLAFSMVDQRSTTGGPAGLAASWAAAGAAGLLGAAAGVLCPQA